MFPINGFGGRQFVGFREPRVVEMGELRVVDGLAHLDRDRVTLGVDDDLARPDAEDGITGNTAGSKDFRLFVAAGVRSADSCGVMERGVDVDTARMIQLMHITRLLEGAIRQAFESSEVCESVQLVCADLPLSCNCPLRASGQ